MVGHLALGFQANNGIFVSRSDDGGTTWRLAEVVHENIYDDGSSAHHGQARVPFDIIPDLAIDTLHEIRTESGTVNPMYVTFSSYYPSGLFPGVSEPTGDSEVFIASSSAGGVNWQVQTQGGISALHSPISDGATPEGFGHVNWARVAVGQSGEVYVGQFTGTFYTVSESNDGGQHFFVPDGETADGQPFGTGPVQVNGGSYSFLPDKQFRTQPSRTIIADPTRPGVVYAADYVGTNDAASNTIDRGDIVFSFSTDYGRTWHAPIVVNDDSGGRHSTGSPDDVTADQFFVRLSVDQSGRIGLSWFDTRSDPALKDISVFATVGTLGLDAQGKVSVTFSPNFRVSSEAFDANRGSFVDVTGGTNYYLGDSLGLAMANLPKSQSGQSAGGVMYAAWTDTRNGNQDIVFAAIPLGTSSNPAAPNDRFESNEDAGSATQLGTVNSRYIPRLQLVNGDEDWFQFKSLATGNVTITANSTNAATLQIELRDINDSSKILGVATDLRDSNGKLIGKQLVVPGASNQEYLVRVSSSAGTSLAPDGTPYSLNIQSLTQDLGQLVEGFADAELHQDDNDIFSVRTAAVGEIQIHATPAADFVGTLAVEVLDPKSLEVLASADGHDPVVRLSVSQAQPLLVHVSGGIGKYRLELTNLDQYNVAGVDVLHFPAGSFPSQEAIADLNGDGVMDVAIANSGTSNVSILIGHKDGTFDTPRQFAVGAARYPNIEGTTFSQNGLRRVVVAADFDENGTIDLAVTNYDSADVSILLGLGDGTFAPQRRFDATYAPFGMTVGDVNDDGHMDLIVVDSPFVVVNSTLAVLLGRGDGSFQPQHLTKLNRTYSVATPTLAFLEGDDKPVDLILGGGSGDGFDIFKSDGQGGFLPAKHFAGTRQSPDAVIADVNGDGKLDILAAAISVDGNIWLLPGNGDGTFREPASFFAGQSPISLALIDWGTAEPDGSFTAGVPDGLLDVVVANAGTTQGVAAIVGPPGIVVLPNLGFNGSNTFQGYGAPVAVSLAEQPLALDISDFNGDNVDDIGVVDRREFFVIYGKPPTIASNSSRESARDLGPLVHVVEPTLTITPKNRESWFSLTVPIESFDTARKQVLDFSGGFANQAAGGLVTEVTDRDGNSLGKGERFRVLAHQGDLLYVHIFGKPADPGITGSGAYTLVIDTLPQLVDVEPLTLLPGGPTTSLELVFQGERLNAATAEVPANYHVVWLGPDGVEGGGDDQEIPVGIDLPAGSRPVVYNPGSNVDVASGLVHPTSVRQTVTLLFGHPLHSGTYKVVVTSNVLSAEFNSDETSLVTPSAGLNGHPVVSTDDVDVQEGAKLAAIVNPVGQLGDLTVFEQGTPFLSQFHYDLGALLNALLSGSGDDGSITNQLIQQVIARNWSGVGTKWSSPTRDIPRSAFERRDRSGRPVG